jgi:hypothetical protein
MLLDETASQVIVHDEIVEINFVKNQKNSLKNFSGLIV